MMTYNVDYLIVGQVLQDGTTQLGYYWLGFQAAAYLLISFGRSSKACYFPFSQELTAPT